MNDPTRLRLIALLNLLEEGPLNDAQQAELIKLLESSDEAQDLYLQFQSLSAGLSDYARDGVLPAGEELFDKDPFALPAQLESAGLSKQQYVAALSYVLEHTFTPKRIAILATAAALMIGVVLAIVLMSGPDTPEEIAIQPTEEPGTHDAVAPIVATITATQNAVWSGPQPAGDLRRGSRLHPNDRLTLTAGFAEITTSRGAVAILEAPATIELLDNANALRLHTGKLVGICETPSSKGFLVRTPHMDITDLGTRFGVAFDEQAHTLTQVFEGMVSVQTNTSVGPQTEPTALTAGQSFAIDSVGRATDRSPIASDAFARLLAISQPAISLNGQVHWSANVFAARARESWPISDDVMLVEELRDCPLQQDILLTLNEPGVYQRFNNKQPFAQLSAGDAIRSYLLIHSVPTSDTSTESVATEGAVTFDGEVLGIIIGHAEWSQFVQATQGQAGVLATGRKFQLESIGPDHPAELADLIELSEDKRTLRFKLVTARGCVDTFRVILREPTVETTP